MKWPYNMKLDYKKKKKKKLRIAKIKEKLQF